jgi:hypothetical protein
MSDQNEPATTTCRTGLNATAEIYLKNVTVDEHGLVRAYEIAYLAPDVDPDYVRDALKDALNLDQPERVRVYDEEDRYLAGHPGTPLQAERTDSAPPCGLVVIGTDGTEVLGGEAVVIDLVELARAERGAAEVEARADEIAAEFGVAAAGVTERLRDLAAGKRGNSCRGVDDGPTGEEFARGRVRVKWVELGEGQDGDYHADDPEDVELLRFDFYAGVGNEWLVVEHASYCTRVPVSTPPARRHELLLELHQAGAESVEHGIAALVAEHGGDETAAAASGEVRPASKRVFEQLSWIGEDGLAEIAPSAGAAR